MKVRFGYITDVHYPKSIDKPLFRAFGGGNHVRRFETSYQRFQEAALFFKEENE